MNMYAFLFPFFSRILRSSAPVLSLVRGACFRAAPFPPPFLSFVFVFVLLVKLVKLVFLSRFFPLFRESLFALSWNLDPCCIRSVGSAGAGLPSSRRQLRAEYERPPRRSFIMRPPASSPTRCVGPPENAVMVRIVVEIVVSKSPEKLEVGSNSPPLGVGCLRVVCLSFRIVE
jgi:hypothetical protein